MSWIFRVSFSAKFLLSRCSLEVVGEEVLRVSSKFSSFASGRN